jgi:glycosyltransferase involved in cell wall biosynthesis
MTESLEFEHRADVETSQLGVSVVIPCRDRVRSLASCLEAVTRLSPAPAEVIVVDSQSESAHAIREVSVRHGARYLRAEKPGVSLAKNIGANAASGDVVAFLDDDAVPASDWLKHAVEPFYDPRVGCVTSRTEPANKDAELRGEYQLLGYVRGPKAPTRITKEDPGWFESACFGGIGISPGLCIRKSVFSAWAGFCERLGPGTPIAGNEEGRAFLDIVRLGYTIEYAPEALVFHPVPVPDGETRQRRYYANLAAATAFLLMLIFEETGCRWPALRYVFRKFRRVSSLWSRQAESPGARLAPGWRVVLARASGTLCYLSSLIALIRNTLRTETQHGPDRESRSLTSRA